MTKQEEILEEVDKAIEPSNMSQEDAIEFLEELESSISIRISAIKDDIERASKG